MASWGWGTPECRAVLDIHVPQVHGVTRETLKAAFLP